MAFRYLVVLLAWVPLIAMADADSRSAGYKAGWYVGRWIGTYGIYLGAAAALAVFGWLWFRRARSRAVRS